MRALVEWVYASGDITTGGIPGRLEEGTRGHQQLQERRGPDYTPEVGVYHEVAVGPVVVELVGRIDGVQRGPGGPTVEEIKTVVYAVDQVPAAGYPVHWAQLRCYAAILSVQQRLPRLTTRLTYVNTRTGEERSFEEACEQAELGRFLLDTVRPFAAWQERGLAWRTERDRSLTELEFPFDAMRPGQREIMDAVAQTVEGRGRLFLHAPTGIGKTMAVLYPSLRSLASGGVSTLFYLTAKGTGKQAATDALNLLSSAGLRAKYLVITAREKICPHPPCDPATCELAQGYYDRFKQALGEAHTECAFLPETITALAAKHSLCPFELSLDLSIGADCIICDYNYAFDPRAFLRRFFLRTGDYLFLVDEAHNLPDRAREMFSAQVTKRAVLDARRGLSRDGAEGALYRQLGRANRWFLEAARGLGERPAEVASAVPADFLDVVSRTGREIEAFLAAHPGHPKRQDLLDLYYSAAGVLRVAEGFDERYVFSLAPVGGRNVAARLYCVDPSAQLERGLQRGRAAVLFSGTLLPIEYFRRLCNRRTDAQELVLPSPFPPANRRVLVHASVATRYRKRSGSAAILAPLIQVIACAHAGNYLVFFPSFAYLSLVSAAYATLSLSAIPVVQSRSMDDQARLAFLGRFADPQTSPVLAFGVMGGVFGESVDLPGELLTGAVVVGPGLPQVCLEREIIRKHHDDLDESGFRYAYVYPGLNRVLQAAGRVIRSETDRGIVVLVGERFAQEPYRRIIEELWPGVEVTRTTDEVDGVLQEFWSASD